MLKKALETLQKYFGYTSFRDGQEEVILSILDKKNTIGIMPTGAGKSICYQIPALIFDGVTIVISPLIALMKDQVDALVARNIPATFINSSLSPEESQARIDGLKSGFYKIAYVAPERLSNPYFINDLKSIEVSLFAIDEAHCISQWGHDFRPSYTKIKQSIEKICEGKDNPTIAALTATATPEVKDDIIKQLEISDANIFVSGFARNNLELVCLKTKNEAEKMFKLINIVKNINGTKIIYAATRKNVEDIVDNLNSNGLNAVGYHAGMTNEERQNIQNLFIGGYYNLLVSTNAFGMGVDKSDIRLIVHNGMPGSIEAYYQEIGRAGRDGKKSSCILFYNDSDRYIHEFFINGENPSKQHIEEVYFAILNKSLSDGKDDVSITTTEILYSLSESISDMAVSSCLKELEKLELIKRLGEENSKIKISLQKQYDELIKCISPRARSQMDLLVTLKREYNIDKPFEELEINLDEFCEKTNTERENVLRTINTINKSGLIEYTPAKRGRLIKLLKKDLLLSIDEEKLENKKERSLSKLNAMEEYSLSNICRHRFILDYFGDNLDNLPENCGMCDNCVKKVLRKK